MGNIFKINLPFFKKKDPKAEFEALLAKCRKEAAEKPNDLRLMTKIAELYLENNDIANAIKEYLLVAKAYQSARKNSIVVGIYRHILALDPSQIEVYHMLTEEFMKDMLTGDAVEVMVSLAKYYYGRDMHYEAAQAIKKIRGIDPDNKFYISKVERFFKERNLDPNAIDQMGPKSKWTLMEAAPGERADINITPEEAGTFNLEQVLGESSLTGFITSLPDESINAQSTKKVEAGAVFDQLKKFIDEDAKQDSPEFHYNLALAYLRRNEHEQAHDELVKALDGIPDKIQCYKMLIDCCLELRRLDMAKSYVNKAEKLPGLVEQDKMHLNYYMGLVYKGTGERKKAVKIFRKIYEQDKRFRNVAREIRELEQSGD